MASSNKHLHITLDERKIIETGIFNGSTRTAIARTIGKDKSTVAERSISIATSLTSSLFLWNAPTTAIAGSAAIAGLPALLSSPSPVAEGIILPVPAMAAPRSVPVVSIISAMMLPLPTHSTDRPFLPRAKASISLNLISLRSVLSSDR